MANIYNVTFGWYEHHGVLLSALGLEAVRSDPKRFRYRDCYPQIGPTGDLVIHVLTRLGGANRKLAQFADAIAELLAQPLFHSTFDQPSDATYGAYVYSVPEIARDLLITARVPDRFALRHEAFRKLELADPTHPEVKRVKAVIDPAMRKILALQEQGEMVSAVMDDDGAPPQPRPSNIVVLGEP